MGASGVKNNSATQIVKPQFSTKPFTTGQKIAVALAVIGALALVLGVLGQVQVGKLASMGSDWNLGLMIGGGVMIILQVGYLLIQMRKKPAASESVASGSGGSGRGAAALGTTASASSQVGNVTSSSPQKVISISLNGQTRAFEVEPGETVASLKKKAFALLNPIQAAELSLYYNGIELREHFDQTLWTIADYTNGELHPLTLLKKSEVPPPAPRTISNPLKIWVKTLSGSTITLNLDASDTIAQVKQRLCEQEGIPPSRQRLIFAGNTLGDGDIFAQHNIRHESTLYVVLTLSQKTFK